MRVEHSWASRTAVVVVGTLALVQLWWVVDSHDPVALVAAWSAGMLTAVACLKMARDNCFESRLVASVVATAQVTAAALAVTVGLPGASGPALHPHLAIAGGLALVVPVLVGLDAVARAHQPGNRVPPPYAS